ncbi:MAG: hypothetical protein LC808_39855 [Actinobacteria bacterium]|nr:hypothetical protein [Actinomycetota bacterium]
MDELAHGDTPLGELYARQIDLHSIGFSIRQVRQRGGPETVYEVDKSIRGSPRTGPSVQRLDAGRPHGKPSAVEKAMKDCPPSQVSICEMRVRIRLRSHRSVVDILITLAAHNWKLPQEILSALLSYYDAGQIFLERGEDFREARGQGLFERNGQRRSDPQL